MTESNYHLEEKKEEKPLKLHPHFPGAPDSLDHIKRVPRPS